MMRCALPLAIAFLVPTVAIAQRERATLPPLHHEAVAFDAFRGRPIVYGGSDSIQGTWAWEGGRWRQIADSTASPPRRDGATMGWDPKRRQIFFFGGWLGSPWQGGNFTLHCDTWTFDGASWTRRNNAPCFTDRVRNNSLVYDTRRDVMLLVDGTPEVPPAPLRPLRLWRWTNEEWALLDSAGPRRPGWDQAAFDESRGVLVIPVLDGPDAGVWEWNGSRWRAVRASGPVARHVYGLTYDPRQKEIVMIGGQTYTRPQTFLDDGWTWNGKRWAPLPRTAGNWPAPHAGGALMNDAAHQRLLYFGGYAGPPLRPFQDLWQFDRQGWRIADAAATRNEVRQ